MPAEGFQHRFGDPDGQHTVQPVRRSTPVFSAHQRGAGDLPMPHPAGLGNLSVATAKGLHDRNSMPRCCGGKTRSDSPSCSDAHAQSDSPSCSDAHAQEAAQTLHATARTPPEHSLRYEGPRGSLKALATRICADGISCLPYDVNRRGGPVWVSSLHREPCHSLRSARQSAGNTQWNRTPKH